MSEIGAAWWKVRKNKDNQPVLDDAGAKIFQLSVNIKLPFLGEINFTLSPNPEKLKSGANASLPDYVALWWPPRPQPVATPGDHPKGPNAGGGYDGPDDLAF